MGPLTSAITSVPRRTSRNDNDEIPHTPRALELESNYQMQFSVTPRTLLLLRDPISRWWIH